MNAPISATIRAGNKKFGKKVPEYRTQIMLTYNFKYFAQRLQKSLICIYKKKVTE